MTRINAGLSPEQLGRQIGLSGRTIRRIESGMVPQPSTALTVANYLGKQPSELWPELAELPEPKEAA